ncbi:MAG: DUF3793 family protein [Ruminococcus sp.]|nr:DUF3793 family protein [Ruminococcus sp.]
MLNRQDESFARFERELALHTSPAMLGAKPANLITLREDGFVSENISRFNSRAKEKRLSLRELCRRDGRVLVMLCNDRLLEKQLCDSEVSGMFKRFGYGSCCGLCDYIARLSGRISGCGDFPHEIGLFLGYPTGDVKAFIEHKGRDCKLCGVWKVYTDVDSARRTFRRYDNCRRYVLSMLDRGQDIFTVLRLGQDSGSQTIRRN